RGWRSSRPHARWRGRKPRASARPSRHRSADGRVGRDAPRGSRYVPRSTLHPRGCTMNRYPFAEVEPRWQAYWVEKKTFRTVEDPSRPKFYCLDFFPYPSGTGLHVGHLEGYTATDILSRYKRMRGFNVLHCMGWDAFGLPAEEYARKTGIHPAITTRENVGNFRRQMKR